MMSLLFSLVLWFHPIHLSITEIEHNEKSKALQVTMRIFIDDLELSIRKKVKDEELDLLEPGKGRTTDNLIKEYLSETVRMKVRQEGRKIELHRA
ncbi:MAG: DUF6702 family protein [Bacteroidota bacterium]